MLSLAFVCAILVIPRMVERIMALIGSISIDLIATNIAYLWDVSDHVQMSESLVNVGEDFVVTKGMCLLWTFGANAIPSMIWWFGMSWRVPVAIQEDDGVIRLVRYVSRIVEVMS